MIRNCFATVLGIALLGPMTIGLFAAVPTAHAQTVRHAFVRYPAKGSGMLARGGDSDVQWLDNDRVIFIGSRPGETRIEDGIQFSKNDLYVWNTVSGEIAREVELSFVSGLCVAPGYIRVHYKREGVSYVRAGKPGLTTEARLDVEARKAGVFAVSPVSCREYNTAQLSMRYGDRALPLLRSGEVLDRGPLYEAGTLRYFPEEGGKPIALTRIPNRDVISIPKYSQHLDKYVFSELRTHISARNAERVWLLDRTGTVEEITIPAGPWMASSIMAYPTRAGWVVRSVARSFAKDMGDAGIYVVRDGTASRFVTGFPYALTVSPDGCKLAVAIELKREGKARPTLWQINLCPRGS